MEAFKTRWDAAVAKTKQDIAMERAMRDDDEEDDQHMEEDDEMTKIGKGVIAAVPGKYPKGSPEHLTAMAAQFLSIYVSLQAEPPTRAGMTKLVAESNLNTASVQARFC